MLVVGGPPDGHRHAPRRMDFLSLVRAVALNLHIRPANGVQDRFVVNWLFVIAAAILLLVVVFPKSFVLGANHYRARIRVIARGSLPDTASYKSGPDCCYADEADLRGRTYTSAVSCPRISHLRNAQSINASREGPRARPIWLKAYSTLGGTSG